MKKIATFLILLFYIQNISAQIIEYDTENLTAVVTAKRGFSPTSIATPPIPTAAIPFQEFSVSAQQTQQLILESGTTIDVPENAFLNKNGAPITGKVQLFYREFNNSLDIFLSGIPMTIEADGGIENLQSAGMFELLAFQNTEAVFPNPDAPISVEMTSQTAATDYNLYEFEEEKNTWVETGKDEVISQKPVGSIVYQTVKVIPKISQDYIRIDLKQRHQASYLNHRKGIKFQLDSRYYWRNRKLKWKEVNPRQLQFYKKYQEIASLESTVWLSEDMDKKDLKEKIKTLNRINYLYHSNFFSDKDSLEFSKKERAAKATRDFVIEPNFAGDNFFLHFISQSDTFTITAYPYMNTRNSVTAQKRLGAMFETYQENFQKRKTEWATIDEYHAANMANYEADTKPTSIVDGNGNTVESKVENLIRRQVDVTKFGWMNIDRLFKLFDEEILVDIKHSEKENDLKISGIYLLDETNNAVVYYPGNAISFVKKSRNSLVILRSDNAVGFVSTEDFKLAFQQTKTSIMTPIVNFQKKEELSKEKVANLLAIN